MSKDKRGRTRLPKRIAGVKIPKKLRKKANLAIALADNPLVRDTLAVALVAGAERLLASWQDAVRDDRPATKSPKRKTNGARRPRPAFSADREG